ncbi:double-stranded RNA-binding protein 6-like isoform X2 [Phalaenopsis equestris]|uniref:double-stranded RNA-binding protein 6-like isoform X2 n=1 Tax=Phalaenopsis equestris TaxID=78828 RepID=UPI0009E421CA|nr:double-stranded RNA-binding protein 6-like isoform X2 [Phalaenopsis equestris]
MYKNQLQELAQRSCFNLPSYTCVREGPDHAPRFRATVNFNGEVFDSPTFCSTLRQAEHAAAEVALAALSNRGPSHSLAARILDETGVYKNLLQEISRRVAAPLPSYTTIRSGLGHQPVFTCNVELAGITFTGSPAKNKKQAEKNAAMAAWHLLKKLAKEATSSSSDPENNDEQDQSAIARALLNHHLKEKMTAANNPRAAPFPKKFPQQSEKKSTFIQQVPLSGSKILPLIQPKSVPRTDGTTLLSSTASPPENKSRPPKFPAAGALRYVPVRHYGVPLHGVAPPVTIRTAVPVFSAPPLQPPQGHLPVSSAPPFQIASPVRLRPVIPVFSSPPSNSVLTKESVSSVISSSESPPTSTFSLEISLADVKDINRVAVALSGEVKELSLNSMACAQSGVVKNAQLLLN